MKVFENSFNKFALCPEFHTGGFQDSFPNDLAGIAVVHDRGVFDFAGAAHNHAGRGVVLRGLGLARYSGLQQVGILTFLHQSLGTNGFQGQSVVLAVFNFKMVLFAVGLPKGIELGGVARVCLLVIDKNPKFLAVDIETGERIALNLRSCTGGKNQAERYSQERECFFYA